MTQQFGKKTSGNYHYSPMNDTNPQEEFAGVMARVESLWGRMGESIRQVEGLFESLLALSFVEGLSESFLGTEHHTHRENSNSILKCPP